MRKHAASLGANAIVGAAFDSPEVGQSMSEVLAYGTDVMASPEGAASPVRLS